jgi:DNA-nicking Smr family endonuclease
MNVYKVDLHRLRHEDAQRAVIHFIEDHWHEQAELEIITGNSNKMKELVKSILDEYKLTCQIGREFDVNNKGYIVTQT